jgi:hypothetical protein
MNNLIKKEIIVKEYLLLNHSPLITIGWKKVDTDNTSGDFITIEKEYLKTLLDELNKII